MNNVQKDSQYYGEFLLYWKTDIRNYDSFIHLEISKSEKQLSYFSSAR